MSKRSRFNLATMLGALGATLGLKGLGLNKSRHPNYDKVGFSEAELKNLAKLGPKAKKMTIQVLKAKYWDERRADQYSKTAQYFENLRKKLAKPEAK